MAESKRTLAVARITAPHGIRGGVRAKLHDPGSTSLAVGRVVQFGADGPTAEVESISAVPGREIVRLQLSGVRTRDEAESLRDVELLVDRGDLPPLDEDEFYLADAIGLPVERLLPSADSEGEGDLQALGTIVGLRIGAIMMGFLSTDERGAEVVPPFILGVSWTQVLLVWAILGAVFVGTIAGVVGMYFRLAVHRVLRIGDA